MGPESAICYPASGAMPLVHCCFTGEKEMPNTDFFDFDRVVDRHGTYCTQWDYVADRFGHADLLPFTISDMDVETAPAFARPWPSALSTGSLATAAGITTTSRGGE